MVIQSIPYWSMLDLNQQPSSSQAKSLQTELLLVIFKTLSQWSISFLPTVYAYVQQLYLCKCLNIWHYNRRIALEYYSNEMLSNCCFFFKRNASALLCSIKFLFTSTFIYLNSRQEVHSLDPRRIWFFFFLLRTINANESMQWNTWQPSEKTLFSISCSPWLGDERVTCHD